MAVAPITTTFEPLRGFALISVDSTGPLTGFRCGRRAVVAGNPSDLMPARATIHIRSAVSQNYIAPITNYIPGADPHRAHGWQRGPSRCRKRVPSMAFGAEGVTVFAVLIPVLQVDT